MKIEVFAAWKHDKFKPRLSWSWRTKVNGRITASAHGYNRRNDAVRAAVNHGYAFGRLAFPVDAFFREHAVKAKIRAAIKVIE